MTLYFQLVVCHPCWKFILYSECSKLAQLLFHMLRTQYWFSKVVLDQGLSSIKANQNFKVNSMMYSLIRGRTGGWICILCERLCPDLDSLSHLYQSYIKVESDKVYKEILIDKAENSLWEVSEEHPSDAVMWFCTRLNWFDTLKP